MNETFIWNIHNESIQDRIYNLLLALRYAIEMTTNGMTHLSGTLPSPPLGLLSNPDSVNYKPSWSIWYEYIITVLKMGQSYMPGGTHLSNEDFRSIETAVMAAAMAAEEEEEEYKWDKKKKEVISVSIILVEKTNSITQ
ncbi:hypothetical protein FRACYDRAFT_244879 [Fragilariopsis cylindrus CCMP1102]|uniref:Uncharacterized protein n=1 Tax=Fragilariopsis cylindrus CCMP1102 TaxID=635003 RepID=A0A1E7F0X8_9STRA|nr:hypothetical protein FRACYDRAFT_244879 [Fragilariopsis cylindrus CCMP1102]|eukprot:OEU11756.1 hypothetical protein FRACYDRAFT_244879 [Fragilariopsis cylindrus CCMP1102]